MLKCFLQTGQVCCYDAGGYEIPCTGTGHDAEFKKGISWPENRFVVQSETVLDTLTGLTWSRDVNLTEFPVTWEEAFEFVQKMNDDLPFGMDLWRLPNLKELRSLISHQQKKPALPEGHPFHNVFLGWYWTSTSAAINPAYAWYLQMEGARMFYGRKDEYHLLWPVSGRSGILPATGQKACFDSKGGGIPCAGTGQDGELLNGCRLPEPRFDVRGEAVLDRLTGLLWTRNADLAGGPGDCQSALDTIASINRTGLGGSRRWRLPNINELDSLVDASAYGPALSCGHPFEQIQDTYWSSTTSIFSPDWAWALYLFKGATGVGLKKGGGFYVWGVGDVDK